MIRRSLLTCALALSLAGCEDANQRVVLSNAAASVTLTTAPPSIEIADAAGHVVLRSAAARFVGETLDRPEFLPQGIPGWDGYQAHEQPWRHPDGGRVVDVTPTSATAALEGDQATIRLTVSLDGDRVQLAAETSDVDSNKIALEFVLADDEHVFGLGERFASVDHRGLGLYAWAEEGALGGGEHKGIAEGYPYPNGPSMTYFPVPYQYSTAGYGLYLSTTRRSEVHLGDEAPERWRVAVNGTRAPLTIYVTADPLHALDEYTVDTGRPVLPSAWAWGNWRRINRGAIVDGVDEYRLMRDRKIPVTTIEDALHFLPHLDFVGQEDAVKAWTATLHAAGYKALAYNNPYVSASDPNAAMDYAYGAAHQLFEKNPDGTPATTFFSSGKPQTVSGIDLTTADGVAWFQSLLQRTIDFGYDGWMHDFGEYVARGSTFGDGRGGEEVHNDYPRLSAKAAWELWNAVRPDDFVYHVRSGYAGSQAFAPVVWGGDAEANFDETQGLPSVVRGGLNLGMSGVPYWGSDASGYKCIDTDGAHDQEVYFRWIELAAVSPIMRDEDACSNPLMPTTKWTLWADAPTQALYRQMASLHTRLAPYLRTLAVMAHATGAPIMMHPVLRFPREAGAWKTEDAYFFGDALYAAPVVRRGVTTRSVWLPPGRYLEWTEGTVHAGGATVEVPAPLDRLPLFLVEGVILPMLDADVQTLAPTTDATIVSEADRQDRLDVIVALGPTGTATRTLVDGVVLTATRGTPGIANTAVVTDPALLASCDACSLTDTFGQVPRVRATTALGQQSELFVGDLHLVATTPRPMRIRWDVRALP